MRLRVLSLFLLWLAGLRVEGSRVLGFRGLGFWDATTSHNCLLFTLAPVVTEDRSKYFLPESDSPKAQNPTLKYSYQNPKA